MTILHLNIPGSMWCLDDRSIDPELSLNSFLPRDALVHSAVMRLLSSVRLSVCLSVCDDQVP